MKNISAIIVAAGQSSRMGSEVPKPYLGLGDKTVLRYSVEAFLSHPLISEVQVIIHTDHENLYEKAIEGLSLNKPVVGGTSRGQSVLNGLKAISGEYVLIHDGARPFIFHEVISRAIQSMEQNPKAGCVPVLPVQDTLRSQVGRHPDRSELVRVQTPQGFSLKVLLEAYNANQSDFTDDAGVFESYGGDIVHYNGSERLFKITTTEDYERARAMSEGNRLFKTGQGFDVHKFADDGDAVILGGISIPHEKGLEGHSDADVVLHALTDAILGTIGAGDIGDHFPPSDDKWRGAQSSLFVGEALRLLKEKGGEAVNADITVICEAPKLMNYKAKMKTRIAELLSVGEECVNIKATTTEGLGFTGRGEGIAAQAIVTVKI